MIPYIVVFILNFLFASLAEKCYARQHFMYLCSMLFIVVLDTIFIGLRDFGVGIDTTLYIDEYFNVAKYTNSIHDLIFLENYDKGYVILAKISSIVSTQSQSLMLLTELLIISFTVLAVNEYKKILNINIPIFITLYWLLYLCHSENLMRQYCAMSMLFYGFSLYMQDKRLSYCILQVIAYFFHSSSVLFLLIPVFYELSKMKRIRLKWIISIIFIIMLVLSLFLYYYLLTKIGSWNIFKDVYSERYGQGSVYEHEGRISIGLRYILQSIVPFLMLIQAYRKKVFASNIIYFFTVLFFSMIILEQFRFVMIYMFRISHYIGIVWIVYQSLMFSNMKISINLKIIYIFVLVASFYLGFMKENEMGWSYWYTSKILGI